MAEPTKFEKETMAGMLIAAFGERHGKTFSLPPDHEDLATRHSCDLVLLDSDGEVVKIQHTRPSGEDKLERVLPDHASQVADLLRECLKQGGIREVTVALTLDPPRDIGKRRQLASCLCVFIAKKGRD